MLFFTRWKAAAIVLTALLVCLCAVPSFFAESTVRTWPTWAQRHIVLGLDLQGGSSLLLEVDTNAVRKERLQAIADDVLRTLRQARIPFTGRAIHGNGVDVRITRDSDVPAALEKLRELSQPLSGILGSSGQRSIDITENAGVITLTPSDAGHHRAHPPGGRSIDPDHRAPRQRARPGRADDPARRRRAHSRAGPRPAGSSRLKEMLGKTAKLDFRMVDQTMTRSRRPRPIRRRIRKFSRARAARSS